MIEFVDEEIIVQKSIDELIEESKKINTNNAGEQLFANAENTKRPGTENSDNTSTTDQTTTTAPADNTAKDKATDQGTQIKEVDYERAIDVYVLIIEVLCEVTTKETPDMPVALVELTKIGFVEYAKSHSVDIKKIMNSLFWLMFMALPLVAIISSVRKKQAKKLARKQYEGLHLTPDQKVDQEIKDFVQANLPKKGCQCSQCAGKKETRGRHHLTCKCPDCLVMNAKRTITDIDFKKVA